MKNIEPHFSIDPMKRFGKSCILFTRITVMDFTAWLNSGMTKHEIAAEFPDLSLNDIDKAIEYFNQK